MLWTLRVSWIWLSLSEKQVNDIATVLIYVVVFILSIGIIQWKAPPDVRWRVSTSSSINLAGAQSEAGIESNSNNMNKSQTLVERNQSLKRFKMEKSPQTVPMLRQVKSETRRDVPMDWEVESTRPYAKHDVSLSRPFSTWSLSDDEPTLSLRKSNVPSSRFVQPLAPSQLASQASFSISTV